MDKEKLKNLMHQVNNVDKTRPGSKKYLKKLRIEKDKLIAKAFELDPKKYVIDKKCRYCGGHGYLGYTKNEPIVCGCVKITKEYKEHLKVELDKVHKEKVEPVKKGWFKGFKKVKAEDLKEKERADKVIENIPTV